MSDQESADQAIGAFIKRRAANVTAQAFKGTRMVAARAGLAGNPAVTSSFLISNETESILDADWPVPLSEGALNWFVSNSCGNDPNYENYNQIGASSTSPPEDFKTQLVAAIKASGNALVLFVHGLGNTITDATVALSAVGINLYTYGDGYPGLVIGFHWPSYDEDDSFVYYATSDSFPPQAFSGSIRDNVNGSRQAFANLVQFLAGLSAQASPPGPISDLKLSLICHSEGNYMAMLGFLDNTTRYFDNILMAAADINDGAFLKPIDGNTYESHMGWANGVSQAGKTVTVYYTNNDDVLPASSFFYGNPHNSVLVDDLGSFFSGYHNQVYGGRLGLSGPNYAQGSQYDNVTGVDCGDAINLLNFTNLQNDGIVPSQVEGSYLSMHTSYFYIPQVLLDMSQVLSGASVSNRTANADANSYTMQWSASNAQG